MLTSTGKLLLRATAAAWAIRVAVTARHGVTGCAEAGHVKTCPSSTSQGVRSRMTAADGYSTSSRLAVAATTPWVVRTYTAFSGRKESGWWHINASLCPKRCRRYAQRRSVWRQEGGRGKEGVCSAAAVLAPLAI